MPGELITRIDDAEVRAVFNKLKQRSIPGGMLSVLSSIGRYGKTSTQLRFRTQTGPDSVRWRPSKRAQREGGETLRNKSKLRNSLSWEPDAGGVAWGTNVTYAPTHQFGYNARQRVRGHYRLLKPGSARKLRLGVYARVAPFSRRMHIPARPFLGVNEADRSAILAIMSEDLQRTAAAR